MPLSDADYDEIFQYVRSVTRDARLGAIDEQITSKLGSSGESFSDLVNYLKGFIDEISSESKSQIYPIIQRFRQHVKTESGVPIQGVRVNLTEDEQRRYQVRELVFTPKEELQVLASELGQILREIIDDRQNG